MTTSDREHDLVERCCRVLHDVASSVPWDQVPDDAKTTQRLAVRALLDYLRALPDNPMGPS